MIVNKRRLEFTCSEQFKAMARFLGTEARSPGQLSDMLFVSSTATACVTPRILEARFDLTANKGHMLLETTSIPERKPPKNLGTTPPEKKHVLGNPIF